ncbi:MAG TPA: wax ester/triacylglycerol synthase family O-acyltransferase [Aeromicrobium sp.]|nr:wax ester/triacylglycerol synthase family O-acyltransferase [Aeromicrobium sp.]
MSYMPPTDAMFLWAESREHPMHVGGLQLFIPPDELGPDFVSSMVDSWRDVEYVNPLYRKRPAEPVGTLGNTWWTYDDNIDFDYHVRHSALPQPRRVRELLALTSRWHGALLDRHRPLWEAHVVEGLADGRVALYTKIHHSMVDGVSALRLMQRSLSEDPDHRDGLPPWAMPPRKRAPQVEVGSATEIATVPKTRNPFSLVKAVGAAGSDALSLIPGGLRVASQIVKDSDLNLPSAPRTILNGRVGGARRFAAQSWEIDRIKRVAKSSGTTINDVVLAMVSGALRDYLLEQGALPDEPMSAMVPVSLALRAGGDNGGDGGNAVGAIVVNLATDRADGATRLEEIAYSSRSSKRLLSSLSPTQILAYSAMQMFPLMLGPIPGSMKLTKPPFNVIVSNVPGPRNQMYFNGAKLDGLYPVSIVLDGQALNITLCSRDKYLDFGLIGCRKSVPHLQRLLTHLESALAELELSWG